MPHSFFSSNQTCCSTSLLSKRWQPLWRSVPAFDFHYYRDTIKGPINYEYDIVDLMNAFLRSRDPLQSLRRFCLECSPCDSYGRKYHPTIVYELVSGAAEQHRLEHLQLYLPYSHRVDLPSVVLSCRTLVVLKLLYTNLKPFSSVDLPSLKTLHLLYVSFPERRCFVDFLFGCPNLEEIELTDHLLQFKSFPIEAKFKNLPKLVRAYVKKNIIPLEVVCHAQWLRISEMQMEVEIQDSIPQFHNLICIEFFFRGLNKNWQEMFKVLEHCPKLQHLIVYQSKCEENEDDRPDWECPVRVPMCISSHLKTCRIYNYGDYQVEFEFARYIMQNTRVLQKMIIFTYTRRIRKMLKIRKKLSLFSSTCKLSIKYYNI